MQWMQYPVQDLPRLQMSGAFRSTGGNHKHFIFPNLLPRHPEHSLGRYQRQHRDSTLWFSSVQALVCAVSQS